MSKSNNPLQLGRFLDQETLQDRLIRFAQNEPSIADLINRIQQLKAQVTRYKLQCHPRYRRGPQIPQVVVLESSLWRSLESLESCLHNKRQSLENLNGNLSVRSEYKILRLLSRLTELLKASFKEIDTSRLGEGIQERDMCVQEIWRLTEEFQSLNLEKTQVTTSSSSSVNDEGLLVDLPSQNQKLHDDPTVPMEGGPLQSQLRDACVTSAVGDVQFLPFDALQRIVSRPAVERVLQQQMVDVALIESYVSEICDTKIRSPARHNKPDRMLKIFALLSLIGKLHIIGFFIQSTDVNDSDLPFTASLDQGSFYPSGQYGDDSSKVVVPGLAGMGVMEGFIETQWMFLAPVFELSTHPKDIREARHYKLDSRAPLPFRWRESLPSRLFVGFEFEVKILGPYYNLHDCHRALCKIHDTFALVCLGMGLHSEFRQWVAPIRENRYLVQPLLTFQQLQTYYMIIPSLETTLLYFLKSVAQPRGGSWGRWANWMANQLENLANGLKSIHTVPYSPIALHGGIIRPHFGWHGTLDPHAIMWLDHNSVDDVKYPAGNLKIFYAGEARLPSPSYKAPAKDSIQTSRSRPADVWALGCAFLDLVTWYFHGWTGVVLFSKERANEERADVKKPYLRAKDKLWIESTEGTNETPIYLIKDSVNKWVKDLKLDPNCSQFMSDLLDLIRNGMLQIQPENRLAAAQIAYKCQEMVQRGQSHPTYYAPGLGRRVPGEQKDQVTDSGYGTRVQEPSADTLTRCSADNLSHLPTEQSPAFLHEQRDLQDVRTVYSVSQTPSLASPENDSYIQDMAEGLFQAIAAHECNLETLRRIAESLPGVLKAFAQKLGHNAHSQIHRDISYFVQKYRSRIQVSFENLLPFEDAMQERIPFLSDFTLQRYLDDPELVVASYPPTDAPWDTLLDADEETSDQDMEDDSGLNKSDQDIYRSLIVTSPAYQWMIGIILREATMTKPAPDIMKDISETVTNTMPSFRVSRRVNTQQLKAVFDVEWDPIAFAKEQRYELRPAEALPIAITLTGSVGDAQALTTQQYMSQTWPTNGDGLLGGLMKAIANDDHNSYSISTMADSTIIEVRHVRGRMIVTALGASVSLAEIAQQLGWLGAALRSSPYKSGVAICFPKLEVVEKKRSRVKFTLTFETQLLTARQDIPGQCWHGMFTKPVLVYGYPVRIKPETGLGLEMPLNMLAAFAGTERATEFDRKLFLKGFTALLVATKICQDMLIWHYHHSGNGERVSYLDVPSQTGEVATLRDIERSRHVVGWCSSCTFHAGAADANHNIVRSKLPRPHATMLLEKATISGGLFVRGGVSFAMAVRDGSPHLLRDSYIPKLQWIAKRYVVLWDEADKTGWLVNGTSALLHLARASLESYRTDDFSEAFRFDASLLKDAAEKTPNSAIKVLICEHNRGLEIYRGKIEKSDESETIQKGKGVESSQAHKKKQGYFLFEDLIERHYNVLEQIIDHQRKAGGRNGVDLKTRVRNHLEGWDFIEIATDDDPIPRVATLGTFGYGWVDFIRSIEAVTLMGRGFGKIIQPAHFPGMCPRWKHLPAGKYYLAASCFDMGRIIDKFGDDSAQPMKAVDELIWHCASDAVAACRCQRGHRWVLRHHDPVQIFYPTAAKRILPLRGPPGLATTGAVVFGHNINWSGYYWGESSKEDRVGETKASFLSIPTSLSRIPRKAVTDKPPKPELGLSVASQSSRSRGNTTDGLAGSSTSTSESSNLPRRRYSRPATPPVVSRQVSRRK